VNEQRIAPIVYIKASLEQVWDALTNPEVTQKYWGNTRIESGWEPGSKIFYRRNGEVVDEHTILEIDRPFKLVHTFQPLFGEFADEKPSRVSIDLQAGGQVVRMALVHEGFQANSKVYSACSEAWPMILSGLKTLLETGLPLPEFTSGVGGR
jgi:uncharacterized protein YndB with AHSA1/START domain